MIDAFLFIGLPYLALVLLVVGTATRVRSSSYSMSALSSQFLERRALRWGSVPWHAGILVVIAGHAVAFLVPGLWSSLVANRWALVAVETLGVAFAVLCAAGLATLFVRRLLSARVQAVTSTMDLIVEGLLFVQIALGLGVALQYRWGASWAAGTLAPYLWSIVTLRPDPTFVAEMPHLVKMHVVVAWVLIACIPYSRLIHMFSVPLGYLAAAPQLVVWSNLGRARQTAAVRIAESRRYFVTGVAATVGGATLLGVGVLDKLVRFFKGPRLAPDVQAALLEERLARVKATAGQRELELERLKEQYIAVAHVGELDAKKGRYFIDYDMRPALAFRGEDGFPVLISAKCTHLGCTVASEVDERGKLLCPCHISWFDLKTGQPDPGAPAKAPLPHIDWVLMDGQGRMVASSKAQVIERLNDIDPASLAGMTVCIARPGGGTLS